MEKNSQNINIYLHTISLDNIEESFGEQVHDLEQFKLQLDEYSQRALLMADKDDYIILNSHPDKEYLEFLSEMCLGSSNILIPKNAQGPLSSKVINDRELLERIRDLSEKNGKATLQPYISTEIEWKIVEKINGRIFGSGPSITRKTNSKKYLRTILHELGIPSTECLLADSNSVVDVAAKVLKKHQEIIVRGELSCGGSAVWAIRNNNDFEKFRSQVSRRLDNDCYLVERMYNSQVSPNIQFEISDDSVKEVIITDQVLDQDLNHLGNIFPSKSRNTETIRSYAQKICDKLRRIGYRGFIGIDFIDTVEGEVFPVEINARVNTSSFAIKVIEKVLPATYCDKQFRAIINLQVGRNITFGDLRKLIGERNIFNKKCGKGILPYNVGCLFWGKFDVLIIADTDDEMQHFVRFIHNLFPLIDSQARESLPC